MGDKVVFDNSEWIRFFDNLKGPVAESLARRMLVSGGVLMRDEAKALAPESDGPYNPTSRGSHSRGTLKGAIYLAKDDKKTSATNFSYKISWNDKIAWWGKLIEFPHLRPFKVGMQKGYWFSFVPAELKGKSKPGKGLGGKLVEAKPFLAPAFDASITRVKMAMIERGRHELPILMRANA
jgi:hypothetical protein